MLTAPLYHIAEIEVTDLVGKNDQVDQNDYGASVAISLGTQPVSGEFLGFTFISSEEGSGSVQTPAGRLILLDADPAVTAGDTAITTAEHLTVVGIVEVAAADWHSDANGALAYVCTTPIAFHALSTLYAVWFHTDATSYNDAAGDDERLRFNAWYRRDG
jgi:hypothetical protein